MNNGKKQWGRWMLDTDGAYHSLKIIPYATTGFPYEVRLFENGCDFPAFTKWLGHWAQHLHKKPWMFSRDLSDFVEAAEDLYRAGSKPV